MPEQAVETFEPEVISLKRHPELGEMWLQKEIKDNPKVLGLGEVEVKDFERIHPGAGRLDFLLYDADSHTRYEVE